MLEHITGPMQLEEVGVLEHGTVSHACTQAWLPMLKVVEDYFEN